MIGKINITIQAFNNALALPLLNATVGSSSTLIIDGIPKKVDDFNITSIKVGVTYPDASAQMITASKIKNEQRFIVTIPATRLAGTVENGYQILAYGTSETNQETEWCLGQGDICVLDRDDTIPEGYSGYTMHYSHEFPENPTAGTFVTEAQGTFVYDGQRWVEIAGSDVSFLSGEIVELSGNLSVVTSNVDSLSNDISTINSSLNEIDDQITSLSDAISSIPDYSSEIYDISGTVEGLTGSVETIVSDIGTLQGNVTDIDNSLTTINENIESLSSNVSSLTEDLNGIDDSIELISSQISILTEDLNTVDTEIESLSSQISSFEKENKNIETLSCKTGQVSADMYGLSDDWAIIPEQYFPISAQISAGSETIIYDYYDQFGGKYKPIIITPENRSILPRLQGRKSKNTSFEEFVNFYDTSRNLNSSILSFKKQDNEYVKQSSWYSVKFNNDPLSTYPFELGKVGVLERLSSVESDIVSLSGQISASGNYDQEIQDLSNEISTLNDTVETLTGDVNTLTGTVDQINNDLGGLQGTVDTITGDVSNLQTDLTSLSGEFVDVSAVVASISSGGNYDQEIQDLSDAITSITGDIETITGDVNTLTGTVDQINNDMGGLQSSIDTITGDVSNLQTDIGNLQTDLGTLSGEFVDVSSVVASISSGGGGGNYDAEISALSNDVSVLNYWISGDGADFAGLSGDMVVISSLLSAGDVAANKYNIEVLSAEVNDISNDIFGNGMVTDYGYLTQEQFPITANGNTYTWQDYERNVIRISCNQEWESRVDKCEFTFQTGNNQTTPIDTFGWRGDTLEYVNLGYTTTFNNGLSDLNVVRKPKKNYKEYRYMDGITSNVGPTLVSAMFPISVGLDGNAPNVYTWQDYQNHSIYLNLTYWQDLRLVAGGTEWMRWENTKDHEPDYSWTDKFVYFNPEYDPYHQRLLYYKKPRSDYSSQISTISSGMSNLSNTVQSITNDITSLQDDVSNISSYIDNSPHISVMSESDYENLWDKDGNTLYFLTADY